MKTLYTIFFCGFLFSLNNLYGQINTKIAISWELSTPHAETHDYAARDYIQLLPGFEYKATLDFPLNNTFTARIEEDIVATVTYVNPIGEEIRPIDPLLPVGATPLNIQINEGGAATCQIPIEVPPGSGGMAPSIFVNYNSQSAFGLLGIGWHLSGISSITRIPRTLHHDGITGGVSLDADDRFALDGNRLIMVAGSVYGEDGGEYRTELNTFVKIISYTSNISNGPDSFLVYTKSGLLMRYGTSSDSRIEAQGKPQSLTWQLKEVTDLSGNSMSFSYYENNSKGEFYPQQISYGGNTIQFYYESDPQLENTYYIGGAEIRQNILLGKIRTYTGGTPVKEYYFHYTHDIYPHLAEVIEYGYDGTRRNSTLIRWNLNTNQPIKEGEETFIDPNENVVLGDFNGDGISDMVTYPKKTEYSEDDKWTLYLNNGIAFIRTSDGNLNSSSRGIEGRREFSFSGTSFDIDGNGNDDLIFSSYAPCSDCAPGEIPPITYTPYLSSGAGFTAAAFGAYTFVSEPHYRPLVPGDYDGDGRLDVLFYDIGQHTWKIYFMKQNQILSGSHTLPLGSVSTFYYDVNPGDFNGNGRTDLTFIQYHNDGEDRYTQHLYIYEFKPGIGFIKIYDASFTGDFFHHLMGDYNGDGKTDILFKSRSAPKDDVWNLYYSDGTALKKNPQSFHLGDFDRFTVDYNKTNFFTADFNGDGKTDVLTTQAINAVLYNRFTLYYSKGLSFDPVTFPNIFANVKPSEFHFGDFNGDGQGDLFYINRPVTSGKRYFFQPEDQRHLVKAISSSLNATTRFNYKTLCNSLIYSRGNTAVYPVQDFQKAIHVVDQIRTDDALGGQHLTLYSYQGAKLHRTGKGLLGFSQITTLNSQLDRRIVNSYTLDAYYNQVPVSTTISTASDVTPISYSTYENGTVSSTSLISFPYVSKTIITDYLRDITTTTLAFYDATGNLSSSSTDYDGEATSSTSATYVNAGAWCTSKPDHVSVTHTRGTEPAYTRVTDYTYHPNGKPATMITDPSTSKSVMYTYSYNGFGNQTNVTMSSTGLISRSNGTGYDPLGRYVTSESNAVSQTTSMTRDPRNGNILTITDPNSLITTNQYDGWGRIKQVTTPTGSDIFYQYNWTVTGTGAACPNVVYSTVITPEGKPTVIEHYDLFGRTLRTETVGFNGTPILSDRTYNIKGELTSESKPYGTTETAAFSSYVYDVQGRLTSATHPETQIVYVYEGRKTTTTNVGAVQVTSQLIDATGKVIESADVAGTITYEYHSCGEPKTITSPDGSVISLEYDAYGRQNKLIDPDAGTIEYEYDAFGDLIYQKDAKAQIYTMLYDPLSRMIAKTGTEGTYTWVYDPANGKGQLGGMQAPNGYQTTYAYDSYSRLSTVMDIPSGGSLSFVTRYGYDAFNNVTGQEYPSGFRIVNVYNTYGFLSEVWEDGGLIPIWKGVQQNSLDQWTQYVYGNAQIVTREYDKDSGYPVLYKSNAVSASSGTAIINMQYAFHAPTGNLMMRSDLNNVLAEGFVYDDLNRLIISSPPGSPTHITYNSTGNILSKTLTGTYTYGAGSAGPHAVTSITNTGMPVFPAQTQDVTYTAFHKVETIEEGDSLMEFTYGPDQERRITELYDNGTLIRKKYYSINYERIEMPGNTRRVHYIPGGDGLAAIYVTDNSGAQLYYVHKDHLGSILLITDFAGVAKEAYSYDAWGRRRDPLTWTYTDVLPITDPVIDRGYTGHEHMDEFGLINMNGRLYDPVVARMLSPDNNVQASGFSQNYNRYSYAFNNPLKYTDPDGQFIQLMPALIGAAVGFTGGYMQGLKGTELLTTTLYSAVTGGLGIGSSASANFLDPGLGFKAGFVAGLGNGIVDGALNGLISGASEGLSGKHLFNSALAGGLTGGALGAFAGGIQGDWQAKSLGLNGWDGGFMKQDPILLASLTGIYIEESGSITIQRKWESDVSTTGTFTTHDESFTGYTLEPPGPSTTRSGQNKRIPAGEYNLVPHSGTDYKNVFKLYNDNVPASRAILIHNGNYPANTKGCILVGMSRSANFVGDSKTALKLLNNYINKYYYSGGVTVKIYDPVKP